MALAREAGLPLDPWQEETLRVMLAERADGKWAAREVALIVPRQNGKGNVLAALALAGLFLFGEEMILHSAHELKTAIEAFKRLKQCIQSVPWLDGLVAKYPESHGFEGIVLKPDEETGVVREIRFVARSKSSGRGFSADRVILDEAFNLTAAMISALMPTLSARENPQIVYTSSAPINDPCSDVLRKICRRGRKGEDSSLAFIEFCCEDDVDPSSRKAWAQANPAYPHRIGPDDIRSELDAMELPDFLLERLGVWVDDEDTDGQVLPAEQWKATQNDSSLLEGVPCFALEVAEDRSWSAIGAAGRSSLGERVHAEVIEYRAGTDWIVARVGELIATHGAAGIVVPKATAAASMIAALTKAGVTVIEVTTEDQARYCGDLLDAVINERLWHRDQAALNVSVRGAVKRDAGDSGWCWSRRRSAIDIGPLVAVTNAAGQFGLAPPATATPFMFTIGGTT